MRVIVRYGDKSKFDGEWADAPVLNVQTIAYIDPFTKIAEVRHQGDYYFIADDGTVVPADITTVATHMISAGIEPEDAVHVKRWACENGYLIGSYIGMHEWKTIYQLGKRDRDSLR